MSSTQKLTPAFQTAHDLDMGDGTMPFPIPSQEDLANATGYIDEIAEEEVGEDELAMMMLAIRKVHFYQMDYLARMTVLAEDYIKLRAATVDMLKFIPDMLPEKQQFRRLILELPSPPDA